MSRRVGLFIFCSLSLLYRTHFSLALGLKLNAPAVVFQVFQVCERKLEAFQQHNKEQSIIDGRTGIG